MFKAAHDLFSILCVLHNPEKKVYDHRLLITDTGKQTAVSIGLTTYTTYFFANM